MIWLSHYCCFLPTTAYNDESTTERKLNSEKSDCSISQDAITLVPSPKKAQSRSPLFWCLSCPPVLDYFLFHSTTMAKAQVKDFSGLLQEALGHGIFGGSLGD